MPFNDDSCTLALAASSVARSQGFTETAKAFAELAVMAEAVKTRSRIAQALAEYRLTTCK